MSDINDQFSDTSSDSNWPLDHLSERQIPDDHVIFENVADQYVKGADVTAFFAILNGLKVNTEEDEIGLIRIGNTNIKECVAYAPVQLSHSVSAESTRHGTATFPAASLPTTDDEFYQFCYIIKKTNSIGSSIPFQLNCASDDIDILSNTPIRKTKADGIIALTDQDNDDLIIIHTKHVLTEEKLRLENRQLLDANRRLECQKDEYKLKLDLLATEAKEHSEKIYNEMQALIASHKTALDELSSRKQSESKLREEYDGYMTLCEKYQTESLQKSDRCRLLEDSHAKIQNEANQIRSQLAISLQLTKDQATQIVDLEHRLMQANEMINSSNKKQVLIEQKLHDLRLISEKNQLEFDKNRIQIAEKDDQINSLKIANNLLQEEIDRLKVENEALAENTKQHQQIQEKYRIDNELAQKEIESFKSQLNEMNSSRQAYTALKTSFIEIEKRCVKHQKSEIEVKRQLVVYKNTISNLESEVQDLTDRLSTAAEEYKTLYRKCFSLEHKFELNEQYKRPNRTILVNTSISDDDLIGDMLCTPNILGLEDNENRNKEQNNTKESLPKSIKEASGEVTECPMCYLHFSKNMTLDDKQNHMDHHFA